MRVCAGIIKPDRERLRTLVADVASGALRTRVATILPLTEAGEAHRRLEAGGLRGKIVLIP